MRRDGLGQNTEEAVQSEARSACTSVQLNLVKSGLDVGLGTKCLREPCLTSADRAQNRRPATLAPMLGTLDTVWSTGAALHSPRHW